MTSTPIKRVIRQFLSALPAKGAVTRAVAMAPPQLKSRRVCRVLSRVIETSDLAELGTIRTNLGFSRFGFDISADAPASYFFGGPSSYAGEYGPLLLASQLTRSCDAFVDVGANHGYFVFFVHETQARSTPIHYFEPDAQLFAELSANVDRLGPSQIFGHRCALGANSGEASFYVDLSDRSSSSLTRSFVDRHRVREERVLVRTFHEFVAEYAIRNACVKVDVECAEFDFLRGALPALHAIRYLIIEVLGPAIKAGFVRQASAQLGMHAYYINGLRLEHSPDGSYTYRPPQYNWLFCAEAPDALRRLLEQTPLSVQS